jgi:acetyl esterase/lipase
MPAGLVAMSPWTDLAITGESYTKNREIDPVFGADGGGEMLLHSPYIGENDAKNPLISPMYGSFTGFPPMLIQVGTHEMLYDDAVSVAKKAKEQGVPVRFTVYEGMFHVFQMSGTVIPESKRAWEEVGAFMHKVMGQW